jgi:hypothetical protein
MGESCVSQLRQFLCPVTRRAAFSQLPEINPGEAVNAAQFVSSGVRTRNSLAAGERDAPF